MAKRKRRPLPPVNRTPRNTDGLRFFEIQEITVGSWGPLPDGRPPQTEVHLYLRTSLSPHPLVMRFKTPEGLDQFVEMLKRHRFDVWPTP